MSEKRRGEGGGVMMVEAVGVESWWSGGENHLFVFRPVVIGYMAL